MTRRPALSRDRIVDTAIAIADVDGVDALSMRKVATALSTGAMSLYNHVADKDELLAAMVDRVVAGLPAIDPSLPFAERLRADGVAMFDVLCARPWVAPLLNRAWPGPARLARMEALLACFADSGLESEEAHHAFHVYDVYVTGAALDRAAFAYSTEELETMVPQFVATIDRTALPHLAAHAEEHLRGYGGSFRFGLDLILDALQARTG